VLILRNNPDVAIAESSNKKIAACRGFNAHVEAAAKQSGVVAGRAARADMAWRRDRRGHSRARAARWVRAEIKSKDVNGFVRLERKAADRQYDIGETVRVSERPFIGFPAVVESILKLDDVGRIVLLKAAVRIFGRGTPVELEIDQVEKMR
jgi:transcription antitermination factor NusG